MKRITKEELIDKILTKIEWLETRDSWYAEQALANCYIALSNLIKD